MKKIQKYTDEMKNLVIHIEDFCPICEKKGKFVNVGNETCEWICLNCKCKTDLGRNELVVRKTGFYFGKKK